MHKDPFLNPYHYSTKSSDKVTGFRPVFEYKG